MALTPKTKKKLENALGSKKAADRIEQKLATNQPFSKREEKELDIAFCDKKAVQEIIEDSPKSLGDFDIPMQQAQQDKQNAELALQAYVPAVAAEASLSLTTDIDFISAAVGAARNGDTITLQVNAPAANNDDKVLVHVTGTPNAIDILIIPNDGTNNAATPVDLTSEELVELINTKAVAGKSIVLADFDDLLELQTASGGDSTVLANAGEGDQEVATFANGADESADLSQLQQDLADAEQAIADILAQVDKDSISKRTEKVMEIGLVSREAAKELKEEIEK